ncbi:hypothetical protein [Kaarinaea lacus]
MKQQINTHSDIDIKTPLKRLLPLSALGLSIMASSPAMAVDINNEENNKIVAAMYGFQNANYIEATFDKKNDDGEDLVQSIHNKTQEPAYADNSAYVDLLIKSVEGTSHPGDPDFSKEEVYVNYLVEVIME